MERIARMVSKEALKHSPNGRAIATRVALSDVADAGYVVRVFGASNAERARLRFGVFHISGVINHNASYEIVEGEEAYAKAVRASLAADALCQELGLDKTGIETILTPQSSISPWQEAVLWMPRISASRFALEIKEMLDVDYNLEAISFQPPRDNAFKAVFSHWKVDRITPSGVITLEALTWRWWGAAWTRWRGELVAAPITRKEELAALIALFKNDPLKTTGRVKELWETAKRTCILESSASRRVMKWLTE